MAAMALVSITLELIAVCVLLGILIYVHYRIDKNIKNK